MTRMIEEGCYCCRCGITFTAELPYDYGYTGMPELCPKCEVEYEKECGLIADTD